MKKFEFSSDYETLLKQASALYRICECQEEQIEYYQGKDYRLSEENMAHLQSALESEKEMNRILTEELEGKK